MLSISITETGSMCQKLITRVYSKTLKYLVYLLLVGISYFMWQIYVDSVLDNYYGAGIGFNMQNKKNWIMFFMLGTGSS